MSSNKMDSALVNASLLGVAWVLSTQTSAVTSVLRMHCSLASYVVFSFPSMQPATPWFLRVGLSQGVMLTITSVQCRRSRRTRTDEFVRRDDIRR